MPATGYIRLHAYTGAGRYPLKDVAVAVTAPDGTAIAMDLTDRSGLTRVIAVPVPDRQESLTPDPPERPYTTVNLYAHLQGYERIEAENVQVFADITTWQNLEMIPLAELPEYWSQTVIFDTPPQNL